MAKSKNITWNRDGKNWENQSYTIKWRWVVSRAKAVREVEKNKHDECWIYTRNGVKYLRALSDHKKNNNIDKE